MKFSTKLFCATLISYFLSVVSAVPDVIPDVNSTFHLGRPITNSCEPVSESELRGALDDTIQAGHKVIFIEESAVGPIVASRSGNDLLFVGLTGKTNCERYLRDSVYFWDSRRRGCHLVNKIVVNDIINESGTRGQIREKAWNNGSVSYLLFGGDPVFVTAPSESNCNQTIRLRDDGLHVADDSAVECSQNLELVFNISGRFDLDATLSVTASNYAQVYEDGSQAFITTTGANCVGGSYNYSYAVRLSNLGADEYNTYTGSITARDGDRQCVVDIGENGGYPAISCN